ncbi:MAG: hypothetical protein J6Y19_09810, partial [Kiritimatiellae bacterium]|nr:hypothetical protein [Kiritimatiellia bacterium]
GMGNGSSHLVRGVVGAMVALARGAATARGGNFASLEGADTKAGYLARLLINEPPFPGERGYVSVEDTESAMREVLFVLHSRIRAIPAGYKQEEIAAVRTGDILDIITARNQCEGFSRDAAGNRTMAPRVGERVEYLLKIANSGNAPGRFARLVNYAQSLASAYFAAGPEGSCLFSDLALVGGVPVTGRAYSWMTGQDVYHPGGNFVRIPEAQHGILGGNRFFTLRKDPK